MAKTITIEFTDAQWDLIVNHYSYNKYFDGLRVCGYAVKYLIYY